MPASVDIEDPPGTHGPASAGTDLRIGRHGPASAGTDPRNPGPRTCFGRHRIGTGGNEAPALPVGTTPTSVETRRRQHGKRPPPASAGRDSTTASAAAEGTLGDSGGFGLRPRWLRPPCDLEEARCNAPPGKDGRKRQGGNERSDAERLLARGTLRRVIALRETGGSCPSPRADGTGTGKRSEPQSR
jgi:hypothetical protein